MAETALAVEAEKPNDRPFPPGSVGTFSVFTLSITDYLDHRK
jgi:hypothetical protein